MAGWVFSPLCVLGPGQQWLGSFSFLVDRQGWASPTYARRWISLLHISSLSVSLPAGIVWDCRDKSVHGFRGHNAEALPIHKGKG